MHHHTDRITHTIAYVTPVVEHWLEREIAQWVHHERSIRRPIAPSANALTTELHLAPHTHLTHSYILKKDPPPQCEHCQCNLTVRPILVECNHFARERRDIFGRRDVVESFRFHHTLIVLFLKQIEFYYKF